ncbi:hypothetical protein B0H14DRAFT_780869 [Mycena olivaceomarginata]|nr:hypothetical protein B0H14DRAFT_780869 [Mycena olivaceomarginata]
MGVRMGGEWVSVFLFVCCGGELRAATRVLAPPLRVGIQPDHAFVFSPLAPNRPLTHPPAPQEPPRLRRRDHGPGRPGGGGPLHARSAPG